MKHSTKIPMAFCHVENIRKPASCFDFFKSNNKGFVPHAVCRECLALGLSLGSVYRKNGMLKIWVKEYINQTGDGQGAFKL